MKETASDGVPTRDTAKNPLMKELVETSPEIPPAVARQREEEEEEEEEKRAKYVQTIIDCGKKLKQHMTEDSLFTVVLVCLKTVLKNLLLKKFSRVVVVYCSVIKVLCLCRSFQATAFIFYQKLLSLSRTFLFFFHCRIRLITSH